eukprot:TRINITY_DN54464_c0_g1_i1.p1 TRINITY_DN54464_c0_g1~~TRINITY_DN54464_c0_g1_i1.p1  ORF type:complete len:516 (-),score=115.05 TRINITY_DN54464_c0_g1_i1:82-1566(-)
MGTYDHPDPDEDDDFGYAVEDQDLSLLIVKACSEGWHWADEWGSRMFLSFGMDGDECRVASFWAILRADAVELYRPAASYNAAAADKAEALGEFLLLRIELSPSSASSAERSASLREALEQVYDVVAACGAPVHGLVYVAADAAEDGSLFGGRLLQADVHGVLHHATQSLGRRIDFIDVSESGSDRGLENLLEIGRFCRYLVNSHLQVESTQSSGVDVPNTSAEGKRRLFLSKGACLYHLLDLVSRSVLAALCARASYLRECWQHLAADLGDKGSVTSGVVIYRTKGLDLLLRSVEKALASEGAPRVTVANTNGNDGRSRGDVREFLKALPSGGQEQLSQFAKLRLVAKDSSSDDALSSSLGCSVEWSEPAFVALIASAGLANYDVGWGSEPRFRERRDSVDDEPLMLPMEDDVGDNYFVVNYELSKDILSAGVPLFINGERFIVCAASASEGMTCIVLDREHGASQGDKAYLVFNRPLAFDEIGEDLRASIEG